MSRFSCLETLFSKQLLFFGRGALRAAGQGEFNAEAHSGDTERGEGQRAQAHSGDINQAEAHSGDISQGCNGRGRIQGYWRWGATDRGVLRAAGKGKFGAEAHSGDTERGDDGQRRT